MTIKISKHADPAAAQRIAQVVQSARGVVVNPDEKAGLIVAAKAKIERYLDADPDGPKAAGYRAQLAELEQGIYRTGGIERLVPSDGQVEAKLRRYARKHAKKDLYQAKLEEMSDGSGDTHQ